MTMKEYWDLRVAFQAHQDASKADWPLIRGAIERVLKEHGVTLETASRTDLRARRVQIEPMGRNSTSIYIQDEESRAEMFGHQHELPVEGQDGTELVIVWTGHIQGGPLDGRPLNGRTRGELLDVFLRWIVLGEEVEKENEDKSE